MENFKNLLVKYRQTIFLFFIGLILIMYISLGFLYAQQGPLQREVEEKTNKLTTILATPLISSEQLQTDYDQIIRDLAPISASQAIEMLVTLANESGIDTDPDSDKFRVPKASISQTTLGENIYQLLSFNNIHVQGDNNNVLAFISALDSGSVLETMVLTSVGTEKVEVTVTGEEEKRRTEFRNVISAVTEMMDKNDLLTIPNPVSFSRGTATNYMGDNTSTSTTIEGFPDITATAADKGYDGTDTPGGGYMLYGHAKISFPDTSQYETVNYLSSITTEYYYTCEADGTVRQWAGPNVATATEYLDSQSFNIELVANLNVSIYSSLVSK